MGSGLRLSLSHFAEPRPQDRLKRHTVEHIIDVPYVQILGALVPQMVDNVMDAFRHLNRPIAEQVLAVPKISCSSCPSQAVLREPQMVEQLPKVDILVSRRGGFGGPQGFLPGQSSSSSVEQIVEFLEVFKVFLQDMVF